MKHSRDERMMAAEYPCFMSKMGRSEADLAAIIQLVMSSLDGCPSSFDQAVRFASKSQRKRIIAAIEIIQEGEEL